VSRYRTPEPIEREALSREELRRLFDAFDSYRNRLIAVVAVETGLRNSDLRNLRIQDLDFDNLEIHVHDPKGSRPYDIPISATLGFELNHWMRHHRSGYASAEESPYVFPSQHGSKLKTNGSLTQIIREAASKAGLQEIIGESRIPKQQREELGLASESRQWHRVTPHTLRHSFITLLAEDDVTLSYRQLVANHDRAETTRNYTHTGDQFEEIRRNSTFPR
jgi:integrase/recombinase XerD